MKEEQKKPSPRVFYDQEKEEMGKTDTEVDAIVRDIYRSAVYGVSPELHKQQRRNEEIEFLHSAAYEAFWKELPEELRDEPPAEPAAEETPRQRTSRERTKTKKKKKRWGRRIGLAVCALLMIAGLYGVAIYSDIPFVRKWRDIYIETAMGTMTHQWLATAFIEDEIIDEVMDTRVTIETEQEEIDTHWSTTTLKGADEKTKWEKLRKKFFDLYSEIDEDSFEAYIQKNGEDCIDEEGYLVIDQADIGADETGIVTTKGDPVLAIDTRNGITIIKVKGTDYEGRLAIIKSADQVGLALASGFGTVGSTVGTIAQENNAVLAVNASGFYDPEGHGNGGIAHGLVIKEGKTYSPFAGGNNKTIGFDYDNNLQIGIYRDGVSLRDAVEFKPALVFDGQKVVEGSAGWGISPRTAIGQTKNGQVLLLVVDGRQAGYSIGCTMGDLADILLDYKAYQACNLDGGSSSIMYYNGRKITRPSAANKEEGRRLPNAFVVSAR